MRRLISKADKYRSRKKSKLQWSMMRTLFFGWFLPLLFLSVTMIVVVSGRIQKQAVNTITTSFDSAIEICQLRVTDAINSSKNISYDNVVRESYVDYRKNKNSIYELQNIVNNYLRKNYRLNNNFETVILYFLDDKDSLYYAFNELSGGSFQAFRWFEQNAKEVVDEAASQIETETIFINVDGRTYLVRNLVGSNFEPYAVLAMELNMEHIFQALNNVWAYQGGGVYIDDALIITTGKSEIEHLEYNKDTKNTKVLSEGKNQPSYVYKNMRNNGLKFTYAVNFDSKIVLGDMQSINSVFILQILFMCPLIFLVFYFFHNRVTRPIKDLLKATNEIRDGNYGMQIKQTGKNLEFDELDKAFNAMSAKLQYQFQKIYLEELAVRDARIMALQSQINPHFLNNTLEIINWEARMTDNYKVSGMIEALSTMLEATLNRKNQSFVSLAEELSYVDAYLFIISQRFGEKFQVIKNIDESLLGVEVPRLIIQPIVENAVEHGTNLQKRSILTIKVHSRNEYLFIEIINNKAMSAKDRANIDRLLSENYTQEQHGQKEQHVSLGIRNVNQRIKIIYGRDCGLKVNSDSLGNTISTIMVKIDK